MLVLITLLFATCLFLTSKLLFRDPRALSTTTMTPQLDVEYDESQCTLLDPEPHFRTKFGLGPGTTVYGWPSKGGLYVLESCNGVELDFLQLDRFNPTPSSLDPAEEDAHCANMRKLGATWWQSEEAYVINALGDYSPQQVLIIGWPPGGGVWVLKTTYFDAIKKGVSRIKNAFNMEERCRAIEQLGGTFYADPKECPDLDL
ncbi:hypothetical protein VTN77DRAFT_1037 [Rasamsonia byssochlamydoides]|uniref:uncharacterized protein n=1 Tax=Rasamsonia byssochlamydoides TaxID=89139 RepID=UPI0037435164